MKIEPLKIKASAIVIFSLIVVFLVPLVVFSVGDDSYGAYQVGPPQDPSAPIQSGGMLIYKVGQFARLIAIVFWIASTISAFYAGFLYFGAGGNPETLKKAHKQIWWTVIAIVIGLMAWGLPQLIDNLLRSPTGYY